MIVALYQRSMSSWQRDQRQEAERGRRETTGCRETGVEAERQKERRQREEARWPGLSFVHIC